MIPQHSSATNEHPTPIEVVKGARRLLGEIDLDPATSVEFNQRTLASRIFTIHDNGLSRPWPGRVMLNPPGGRITDLERRWLEITGSRTDSTAAAWWDKLATEYEEERTEAALFVGFTLEILRTSQSCVIPVQAFPRCYPKKRLAFKGEQPTHANVLVYLPPKDMKPEDALLHLRVNFGDIGLCEGGMR